MACKRLSTSVDPETYQQMKDLKLKPSALIKIGLHNVKAKETLTALMKAETTIHINKILDIILNKKLEEIGLKKQMEQLRPTGNLQVEIIKLDNRINELEKAVDMIQRAMNE